jgi:hypothetical protein
VTWWIVAALVGGGLLVLGVVLGRFLGTLRGLTDVLRTVGLRMREVETLTGNLDTLRVATEQLQEHLQATQERAVVSRVRRGR